jgi:hypothetical protein
MKDFINWLNENENFDDFDTNPGHEEDFAGKQQYNWQNQYQQHQNKQPNFSSGMSLNSQEVSQLKDILAQPQDAWHDEAFAEKYEPSFLWKLHALGLFNN